MTTFQRNYDAMGSRFSIRLDLWPEPSSDGLTAAEASNLLYRLETKTEQLEQSLSRFRQNSELMQLINRMDKWTEVSSHMEEILKLAERSVRLTESAFDPRILPALERIGYHGAPINDTRATVDPDLSNISVPELSHQTPRDSKLFRRNEYDEIQLISPVDLGGIGKGYTADCLADVIESAVSPFDLAGFIIDAGGDVVVSGCQDTGEPWNIGIENPLDPSSLSAVATPLGNYGQKMALCTSSLWRNAWTHEGEDVHHLINPATGMPAQTSLYSVTAIADAAAVAEVMTKYVLLRGFTDAPIWRDYPSRCLWITKTGDIHMTTEMEPYVIWLADN